MRRLTLLLSLLVLVAVALGVAGAASPSGSAKARWVIRDLGSAFEAYGINDSGQIVGSHPTGSCGVQPVLWQQGKITVLTRAGDCGVANAINDHGQIVGWHSDSSLSEQPAFLWQNGKLTQVEPGEVTEASGINNRGQVVGLAAAWSIATRNLYTEWDTPRAFLWDRGKVTWLTSASRWSEARAIDDHGRVVGWMRLAPSVWHAFVWESGRLRDLGTLPGRTTSQARGVNVRGQVVGLSYDDPGGSSDAFLWENGRMTNLIPDGGLHSVANAIDGRGRVVGSTDAFGVHVHAFVWDSGRLTDLGTLPGETTSEAVAISSKGLIVGTSGSRAVLWTPRAG